MEMVRSQARVKANGKCGRGRMCQAGEGGGPVHDYYVARWSRQERDRLVIVDPVGKLASSFPVQCENDRPGWELLLSTGWCAYPGSEWEEESPGHWSVPVFSDKPVTQGGGGYVNQLRSTMPYASLNSADQRRQVS
jgi:hypothetical protein